MGFSQRLTWEVKKIKKAGINIYQFNQIKKVIRLEIEKMDQAIGIVEKQLNILEDAGVKKQFGFYATLKKTKKEFEENKKDQQNNLKNIKFPI